LTISISSVSLKKIICALSCALILASCSSDDARINNPNLRPISFSISLNTNLPEYSILQFPGNAVSVENAGIRGIVVINTGAGILAWEASDPNHLPNDCSAMTLDGVEVTCPCEDNTYNLYNGQDKTQSLPYTLLPYRVAQEGNLIIVSN